MSITPVPEQNMLSADLDMHELLAVFRRRRRAFAHVFVMVLAAGIVWAAFMKPVYRTQAKLLVPASNASLSVIDSNNPIGAMLAAAQPDSVSTQLLVLQSGPFMEKARQQAKVVPRADVIPPTVRTEALGDTNVIQITVEGGDPQEIARLANAIVDLHLKETDLLETTGLGKTMEFVRKEKDKAAKSLTAADSALFQFQQQHKGVDLLTEREARAGESTALQARALEVGGSITLTKAQIAHLQTRLAEEPKEIARENPRAAKLQEKLEQLQLQRTDMLREYRPVSRPIRDLDGQISTLQQQIDAGHLIRSPNPIRAQIQAHLEDLEATLQGQEQDYNAVTAQLKAKQDTLNRLGPWASELTRLTHDRDAVQGAYTMLSDRLRDLEIRAGARLPTARPIEWASAPSSPIRPMKTSTISLAALVALLLASAAIIAQEYLDDRINSPEDVDRLAGLPALGHLPMMPADQPRLLSALPSTSHLAEAFRSLRSSVGFAGIDAPIRRLQITSSVKGEGKSTTAVNLAMAMAQDGKKVILVDGDLRGPSVHRVLECPRSPGLSEVLAGMKTLEQVIQDVPGYSLRVIPAGSAPPYPAELLGSHVFEQVLQQLEAQADIVIVDSPPCIPVTDPVVISSRMEAVVLVLRTGETRKGSFKRTVEMLSRARAGLAGVVMNQVQPQRSGYYAYSTYQYYYYGEGSNGASSSHQKPSRRGKARGATLPESTAITAVAPRSRNGNEES